MYIVKAGESHGKYMVGILCNVPAGILVEKNQINALLKERSNALGRSERQKAEKDKVDGVTGIRNGFTLGNNVSMLIKNNAVSEYQKIMDCFDADTSSMQVTALRPGHADLGGVCRGGFQDARNVLEGASARNTCLDVALGSVALSMLSMLGINVAVSVKSLGDLRSEKSYTFEQNLKNKAPAFSQDRAFVNACKNKIEDAKKEGESLGGVVEICVSPIKPGFGSFVGEKRVDALIAQHLMQIQAVKGVSFGENSFDFGLPATTYHGKIERGENGLKTTSLSGGIDGGMTNGDYIKIAVGIKAIPTTKKGVSTIDIATGEQAISAKQRSDITAVFALCPILKCVVSLALSEAITERLGCDNMTEIIKRYNAL